MQTVLLTGGTGFLGSNLLKRLLIEQYRIILIKRSTSNTYRIKEQLPRITSIDVDHEPLENIFKKHKIDIIIHCATNYGRRNVPPTEVIEANLFLPLKLLHLAKDYQVKVFINTDTILDKRVNTYSLSKKQFIEWFSLYSDDIACINIAIEHFYGPMDDRSKFVTQVILDLLQGVKEIPFTLGEQKRDFIYIDDVVNAFLHVLKFAHQKRSGFHRFEVGSSKNISICDFVKLTQKLTGNETTHLNFGVIPYRKNEIMESSVNIQALRVLGWEPLFSLEEGLIRTIDKEKELLKS